MWSQKSRNHLASASNRLTEERLSAEKHGELARPEGETSNSLLDTLADWNTYLELHAPSYRDQQLLKVAHLSKAIIESVTFRVC